MPSSSILETPPRHKGEGERLNRAVVKELELPAQPKGWRRRVSQLEGKLGELPFALRVFKEFDKAKEVDRWREMQQLPLKVSPTGKRARHSRFDYVERFIIFVSEASFRDKQVPSAWSWDHETTKFVYRRGFIRMGDLLVCWLLLLQYGHLHDGHIAERFFLHQLCGNTQSAVPSPATPVDSPSGKGVRCLWTNEEPEKGAEGTKDEPAFLESQGILDADSLQVRFAEGLPKSATTYLAKIIKAGEWLQFHHILAYWRLKQEDLAEKLPFALWMLDEFYKMSD